MTRRSSVSPSHPPLPPNNFIIETTRDELCFAVVSFAAVTSFVTQHTGCVTTEIANTKEIVL